MELKDLKDVSKLVDRKLQSAAKKEKQLQEQEQKELEEKDQEEETQIFTHENADENEKTNTSVTQKVLFCVGVIAVVVGVVQLQKTRSVNE